MLHIVIRKGLKLILNKLITIFKLITEHFEEDKHKNDFANILRALISPFSRLNVNFPWIIREEVWKNEDFQLNLWKNIGEINWESIHIKLDHITQEDIEITAEVINEHIFPWLKNLAEKSEDKNQIKTVSMILWDVYSHICTLFPSKRENSFRDFTSFYYKKNGIDNETINKLKLIEKEIYNITEILHLKVVEDDVKKRNEEIIWNIGSIYKQIIQWNVLSVK